jgi:hypothetical protein
MKIPKPTDADKHRFRDLAPDAAGVEVKPMFGNLGAFVNGNMFMGLFGSDIGVKLPNEEHDKLLAQPGSGPFGPSDRPMSGYATLPSNWSGRKATPWIDKALAQAAAQPQRTPKQRTTKKAMKKTTTRKRA